MGSSLRSEISLLLSDLNDPESLATLMRLVYVELRRIAAHHFRGERIDHTLQPTALVHEAYLRLFTGEVTFQNRAHFFGAASQAMRRILIEQARRHRAEKRGGVHQKVSLDEAHAIAETDHSDYLAIDEALNQLQKLDPHLARIVELRIFGGLSAKETAEILGMGESTVRRDWTTAKAWLERAMG